MTGWDLRALPTHPPVEHAHHLHAIDLEDAQRIVRNLVHGQHFAVVACECETPHTPQREER